MYHTNYTKSSLLEHEPGLLYFHSFGLWDYNGFMGRGRGGGRRGKAEADVCSSLPAVHKDQALWTQD